MSFWRPARPARAERSAGGEAELYFSAGERTRPLVVRRAPRAQRMRLAVDPRTGEVRLTLPPRAPLAPALAWAQGQRAWIERTLAGLPDPVPFVAGGHIPFEGEPLRIDWRAGAPRAIRFDSESRALVFGGPEDMLAPRVLRWLRREALARLEAETRALAARAGVTVGRVAVGDARARWGSCTESGDIRYSWRLVLAPVRVREAIVAHEVAHRLHMHHGPDFHAAVAALLGRDPAPDHAWLRRHGAALYWLGRLS